MAEQQMQLNTDLVTATINKISELTNGIQEKNKQFLTLLQEKNSRTKGKFDLLVKLEQGVTRESENFAALIEAQEEVKNELDRYAALIEEANDSSALRLD